MAKAELNFGELSGGGGIDIANPDYSNGYTTASISATFNVTTTSKPKYFIWMVCRSDKEDQIIIGDIENETLFSRYNNNGTPTDCGYQYATQVSNVSSTGFTLKSVTGANVMNMVFVYY